MYLNVADREALAEYVSALQVVKCMSVGATPRCLGGAKHFGVDSVMQRIAHGWWCLTNEGNRPSRGRARSAARAAARWSVNEEACAGASG